jgi:hypothetical protein
MTVQYAALVISNLVLTMLAEGGASGGERPIPVELLHVEHLRLASE